MAREPISLDGKSNSIQSLRTERSSNGGRAIGEKCGGTDRKSMFNRFLPQPFPSYETRWLSKVHRKYEGPKSVYSKQKVHHAQPSIGKTSTEADALHDINRPEGCVFPYINTPSCSEIPSVCNKLYDLSIPYTTIRINNSTTDIHSDHSATNRVGCETPNQHNKLFRRLPDSSQRSEYATDTKRCIHRESYKLGLDNKPGKIQINTITNQFIHRNETKSNHVHSVSHTKPTNKLREVHSNLQQSSGVNRDYSENERYISFIGGSDTHGQNQQEALSICHKTITDKEYKTKHTGHRADQEDIILVDGQKEHTQRSESEVNTSQHHTNNRCIHIRLGGSVSKQPDTRKMVQSGKEPTYKYIGTVSHPHCDKEICQHPNKQTCINCYRQHDSNVVPEERRRNSVRISNQCGAQDSRIQGSPQHHTEYYPHSIRSKRTGRQTEQGRQAYTIRMATGQEHIQNHMFKNICATDRSICKQVELPGPNICKSLSRQYGETHQRNAIRLEHLQQDLPLPTNKTNDQSDREIRAISRGSNIDCTIETHKQLPHKVNRAAHRPTDADSKNKQPIVSRSEHKSYTSQSRGSKPTRVGSIRRAMQKKGFSKKIAELASKPQRKSSISRYNYIWKKFKDWYCNKYDTDPFKASVIEITEYLVNLRDEGKAYATILTHKSAICTTLTHTTNKNHSKDSTLQSLLKHFRNNIPNKSVSVPDWNFQIVLAALSKEPFEPLNDTSIKYITMKTLFLTAWASAARVSEIHALSTKCGHFLMDSKNRYLDLIADSGFIAKNQLAAEPPRKYRINAIRNHIDNNEPDCILCPVRALRIYKKRTEQLRTESGRLFVCIAKKKDMSVQSISYWLKRVIKLSYELTRPQELDTLHRVTPHEIRAVSASFAVAKHIPIKSIMKNAYWKSETVFTSYYLKDIAKYTKEVKARDTVAAGFCVQF